MSNSAINWARKIEGLTSPQAFVLWVICDRYNEQTHTAWPSINSIATDTRLAPRTVTRALSALEDKNLIVRGKTYSAKHDGWASNTYFLPAYDPRSRPRKNVKFQEVRDYEASFIKFRTIDEV
jgi:DNA-binding transcriptional ArsR family regulator